MSINLWHGTGNGNRKCSFNVKRQKKAFPGHKSRLPNFKTSLRPGSCLESRRFSCIYRADPTESLSCWEHVERQDTSPLYCKGLCIATFTSVSHHRKAQVWSVGLILINWPKVLGCVLQSRCQLKCHSDPESGGPSYFVYFK